MPKVMVILVGCIFVGFGRWLYSNPRRMTPDWWPGANSKTINDFSRFMGIAFVFVGAASASFAITELFVGGLAQVILALACASTITWASFPACSILARPSR